MNDLLTEPIINQINKKINYTASTYKNYNYDEIKELYYFYAVYYASKYDANKCDNFKNYLIYNLNYITNNFLFYYNYFNSTNKQEFGIKPEIRIMGPIVGTHVGPNAVAVTFMSNEERKY